MPYEVIVSEESINDVIRLARYMNEQFFNPKAADDFLDEYEEQVRSLEIFPKGYRGISIEYRGYEIHLKPFGTYNIFFIIDEGQRRVAILRVLKDLRDWNMILRRSVTYHFVNKP